MTSQTNTATLPNEPWAQPWPAEDLETVGQCPVCGDASRKLLHADLVDSAFRTAPGKWALWACTMCRSAYLDPRPTPATIHRAYANYYTHQASTGKEDYAALSQLRKLRRRLVNGYTNWRYGTQALPSSPIGVLLAYSLPSIRKVLDREYRHLPKRPQAGGHLLDVGCGNGSFLSLARTCGWSVVGLDPDPMAVVNAARQGLTVHEGGIEHFDGQAELFDVITLNHVIEHLHEPVEVLKRCYALLKPGGQLWMETPNIDSFGHARFQKNWRGLETPRHLVLFNRSSLKIMFMNAGFGGLHYLDCPSPSVGMYRASLAIENCQAFSKTIVLPKILRLQLAMTAIAEIALPKSREFMTAAAKK